MFIKEIAFSIYAVTDMKTSRSFYEGSLELVPSPEFPATDDSSWIEYNIGSGTLAIGCSPEWKPSADGASVGLEVEDFDKAMEKLKKAGTSFFMEPQDFPNCSMAVIEDPDKNKIVIHHKKK